jgi:hypothetical protein
MKATMAREYIDDSTALLRDLEDLYSDYEFVRAGGKVHYAVDFSEVHAYVLPDQSADAMRAFRDDDAQVARAVQVHALNGLFNDPKQRPILLSPYVIELEAFIRGLTKRDFTQLGSMAVQALDEHERLQFNPELEWIQALAQRVGTGASMSAEDAERAQRFVERHAVALVNFLTEAPDRPRRRLHHLLTGDVFQELARLIGRIIEPDLEFARRAQQLLDQSRPRYSAGLHADQGSNHLDALAIALVREANRQLEARSERIRLVTRSTHVRQACEKLAVEWQPLGGSPVRHPRFFSAFHALVGNRGEDARAQLNVMRQSLEAFLAAYATGKGARQSLSGIEREIATLKTLWRTSLGLSATLLSDGCLAPERRAQQMLVLFSEGGELRKRLERRIVEMADEMQRDYQALGLLVRAQSSPRDRELVQSHFKRWGQGAASLVGSSLHYMPYMLEFHTSDVREALERPETSWQELSRLGPGRDFERLLAMAYLFGTWDQWPLAERYCDLALNERDFAARFAGDQPAVADAMHEGYYFKAICIKEQADSVERMREAFELVKSAELALQAAGGDREDARYLQEKAEIVFHWHELIRRSPRLARSGSPLPPDRDAAVWSRQVLKLLENARSEQALLLKSRVHNNLCYFFGEKDSPETRKVAARHLSELEVLSEKLCGKWPQWPPNVLDTVAWVRWRLGSEDMTEAEREHIERQLETALRNTFLRPREKREIGEHLRRVRAQRHP